MPPHQYELILLVSLMNTPPLPSYTDFPFKNCLNLAHKIIIGVWFLDLGGRQTVVTFEELFALFVPTGDK